jgi:hypothetical protein
LGDVAHMLTSGALAPILDLLVTIFAWKMERIH